MIKRAFPLLGLLTAVSLVVPMIGQAAEAPSDTSSPAVGKVRESFAPRKGKIFIAVIGNDARSGNPNLRADAVHIVGINTRTMKAGILNFPRDTWTGSGRILETTVRGGPQLTVRTLERITGIKIDYWVMTGFEGFKGIVNDVGNIRILLPRAMYDPRGSGARLPRGRNYLNAETALAFARTRKTLPGGDVDRTHNQGRLMLAMLRRFKRDINVRSGLLFKWFNATRRHTRRNIPAAELFRLGVLATQLKRKDVNNVTVPVSLGSVGAASVVFIQPSARQIFRRFRARGSL
jgi:polyisoprenyl-teichoic acid--peptidoglycan teichoic acid transferase